MNIPENFSLALNTILKLACIAKTKNLDIPTPQSSNILGLISRRFDSLLVKDKDFDYELIPTFFRLAANSGSVEYADLAWGSLAKNSSVAKLVSSFYFVVSEILGDVHRSTDKKSPDDQ